MSNGEVFSTEPEKGIIYVMLGGEVIAEYEEELPLAELLSLAKEQGVKTFQVKKGDIFLGSADFPIQAEREELSVEIVPVFQAKA